MKKSLIVLTVILASVALAGAAIAAGAAACAPPVPTECQLSVPTKPVKPKPVTMPMPARPSKPQCVTVPCPPMQVTIPGKPYAIAEQLAPVPVKKEAPVFRDLCVGKSKGACPAFCGPCAPMIKWACNWKTSEECGKVTYTVTELKPKPYPIDVRSKMVPKPVECFW